MLPEPRRRRAAARRRGWLALPLLWLPGLAFAWGPLGHEVVAEIAARHLTPEAQALVEDLLDAPPADALRDAASWADDVRAQEGLGITAPYHYVNFPRSSCSYTPARDCPGGRCIVSALERFTEQLRRDPDPAARAVALKWVLHLTADVHQPLHAGRAEDRGGNDVQVRWQRDGTNLHALLDSGLIARRGVRPVPYATTLLTERPQPTRTATRWNRDAPRRWTEESCRLVPGVYPKGARIDRAYADRTRELLEQRLLLAGLRLAALLNAAATP